MIKLENVTTRGILSKESGIDNYQQLLDLIRNGRKDLYKYYDNAYLTEKQVDKANRLGKEPLIYQTTGYSSVNLDQEATESLYFTDHITSAAHLLCFGPLIRYSARRSKIGKYTIAEIKHLLSHCLVSDNATFRGQNALVHYINGLGYGQAEKIFEAINLYEEQVLRQLSETETINLNNGLFYNNFAEKTLLVVNNIDKILDYMSRHYDSLIWGTMSNTQQNILLNAFYNNPTNKEMDLKNNFIGTIAEYTCLNDYEQGEIKEEALKRFIKK